MATSDTRLLQIVHFADMIKWSAHGSTFGNEKSKFPLVPLSIVLRRIKEPITIEDGVLYKRITIRNNGRGVVQRDELLGSEIGTKRQFVAHAGQFIISRIDARNGAFGIVPEELEGAVVTNDFWLFEVQKALPEYLMLVLSSERFQQYWQAQSSGTTNRQRIDEQQFLSSRIILPSLGQQAELIRNIDALMSEVVRAEKSAAKLKLAISEGLIKSLRLLPVVTPNAQQVLQISSYKVLESKWEWNPLLSAINRSFSQCKYATLPLDKAVNFVNRGWMRQEHNSRQFRYIEIGGVDAELNIAKEKVLDVKDAPSRATQIVKTGDLIIGTTRPYLKRFAIIQREQSNSICSSGFQVVAASEQYDLNYVLEVLKLDQVIKQFEALMTGALYPAVNGEQIKRVRIPMPPLQVQREIAAKVALLKQGFLSKQQYANSLRERARCEFEAAIFESV